MGGLFDDLSDSDSLERLCSMESFIFVNYVMHIISAREIYKMRSVCNNAFRVVSACTLPLFSRKKDVLKFANLFALNFTLKQ